MSKSNKRHTKSNQLRIIGGQWRGRKLQIADVVGLRPTGDRIRETVFNWLSHHLPGSECLDLFAGSGALGFESLSRGAKHAAMLEQDPVAARQLKISCNTLQTEQASIVQTNTLTWLQTPTIPTRSVNIVFIDPPFAENLWQRTIDALLNSKLLAADAMVYVEAHKNTQVIPPTTWHLYREKFTGDVSYRLFQANS